MRYTIIILALITMLSACEPEDIPTESESPKAEKVILAIGDSLTAGLGVPLQDSYPSQLETILKEKGYTYRLINAGVSGDTSAGLLSRIDWVLEGFHSTDKEGTGGLAFVILCIGANDAFQGKSVEDIEKNIRAIIEKIRDKNVPILFAGMKAPLNLGGEYGRKYEAIFPKLAKEYNLVFMDFFLKGVALKSQYNQDDRIHPTASGYAIVVENLMEILEDEEMVKK